MKRSTHVSRSPRRSRSRAIPVAVGLAVLSAHLTGAASAAPVSSAPQDSWRGGDVERAMTVESASVDRVPNGRIAYHAYVDRLGEIYTIGPNGNGTERLTYDDEWNDVTPAYSPSGRRIAFAKNGGPAPGGIFVMRSDGSNLHRISFQFGVNPVWSPSGRRIAYACFDGSGFEICRLRSDGSNLRQLTHGEVFSYTPDWSVRGRISYSASDGNDEEIYTMNSNGRDVQQVTDNTTHDHGTSFSPSGARVAYGGGGGEGAIFIKRANGNGPRVRIPHTRGGGLPSWSPNGRRIAYAAGADIWTIRIDGTDRQRVTNTPHRSEDWPRWGPRPTR